jgi:8-oxo-dGTP diphosphatase
MGMRSLSKPLLMDFTYYLHNCFVEVYAGKLKLAVDAVGEENELYWSDLNRNFFDLSLFAGEGNIGHMIEQVNMCKEKIFGG